jgi:hypothetical protein
VLVLAAYSTEPAALDRAQQFADSHIDLTIILVEDPAKEPWPLRICGIAADADVWCPVGARIVKVFGDGKQLALNVGGGRR